MICKPPVYCPLFFLIFERMAVLAVIVAFLFEFRKIDFSFMPTDKQSFSYVLFYIRHRALSLQAYLSFRKKNM